MNSAFTPAVSLIPPNQASLFVDTGGSSGNPLDNINTPISSGLGGLARLEYDNLFWSNDFFTITTRNAAIGLFVGYYVPGQGASYCLLPIALPRQSLALPYDDIRAYQEAIAYALNLYFAGPKTVYVYDEDGRNPTTQILAVDTHSMPILQTDFQPPLIWKVNHSGQLVLLQNTDTSLSKYMPEEYVFNFNLVKLTSGVTPEGSNSSLNSSSINGWIGSGKYVFGFGKYDGGGNYVDDMTYYDVPSNTDKPFTYLCRPGQPYFTDMDLEAFDQISYDYKLFRAIVADSSTLCIPTKYFTIDSRELSRNQLRPMATNINRNIGSIIAIIFTSPFGKNKFSATSPFMFNDASSPCINLISNQPHNRVDLNVRNEFNTELTPYNLQIDYPYINDVEGIYGDPTIQVPIAYDGLNPFILNEPDGWSVFPFYMINDNLFRIFKSPTFLYNANTSTNVVHFAKMIAPN